MHILLKQHFQAIVLSLIVKLGFKLVKKCMEEIGLKRQKNCSMV